MKAGICLLMLIALVSAAEADSDQYPGEPLTLSEALSFSERSHPSTRGMELDLELARTNQSFAKTGYQPNIEAVLKPQRANRVAGPDSLDDSSSTLRVIQPIYDFGRTAAIRAQSDAEYSAAQQALKFRLEQRRIEIMQFFFNVLISDLDYAVKNEKMTLAFLHFNRLREETDMFESHAEVDVLAAETLYREKFHVRQQAGIQQQSTRRRLGISLGFADYVPRDLVSPDVSSYVNREVPEFESMLAQVWESSPEVAVAKLNLEKEQGAADQSVAQYRPTLEATLEATDWRQDTGSRNSASIALQLKVPLWPGAKKARDNRIAEIRVERARSRIDEVEYELRIRVYELWKQLRVLQVEKAAADIRTEYRDQYMDRSRTLYELEERADLGDAQAELLRSLLEATRIDYQLALTWAQLDLLMGKPVFAIDS